MAKTLDDELNQEDGEVMLEAIVGLTVRFGAELGVSAKGKFKDEIDGVRVYLAAEGLILNAERKSLVE